MGLEYIIQPQVFVRGLTALGQGIQGLTENYPLLTTYNYWTSTALVPTSSFPIPGNWSIYDGPNNSASFIVNVGGVTQSPEFYSIDIINRRLTFGTAISAGIEIAVTQLATASPSSQSFDFIKSVSAEFITLSAQNIISEAINLTASNLNTKNLVTDTLLVTNLTALSSELRVVDITQYELSGFKSTGDIDITGNVTMTGSLSTGSSVLAAGPLLVRTKSDSNIFIGDSTTGRDATTGNHNVFVGSSAGRSNTTGFNNNFFGLSAGVNNTTGCSNNFSGHMAGFRNYNGYNNNFFGNNAGGCNSGGGSNNFFGYRAGFFNCLGSHNNFFGRTAGCCNTFGSHNNFLGNSAGSCNTTGRYNNFLGQQAGGFNITGKGNNFIGFNAGINNRYGAYNNIIGHRASTAANTNLSGVIVIGTNAIATQSHQIVLSTANVLFRSIGNTFNVGTLELQNNLTVYGNISATGNLISSDSNSLYSFGGVNSTTASPGQRFYGTNSDISLEANSTFELVFNLYYTKTTATTVVYAISGTTGLNNITAFYTQSPATGIAANGATTGAGVANLASPLAAVVAFPATPSLTTAVNHHAIVRAIVETGIPIRVNLVAWNGAAGSITPLTGSYWTKRLIN